MKTNETTGLPEFDGTENVILKYLGSGSSIDYVFNVSVANALLREWFENQQVVYSKMKESWHVQPEICSDTKAYLIGIRPIEQDSVEKLLKDIASHDETSKNETGYALDMIDVVCELKQRARRLLERMEK